MAYMSHVTHDKLVGKYTATKEGIGGNHISVVNEEIDGGLDPEEVGVVGCGGFQMSVRCCAPVGTVKDIRNSRVWCGEADGEISIRESGTGRRISTVGRKQGVFVTVLRYHSGVMYAGMSDGYLRAYETAPEDGDDYNILSESKKHTGDILCIETVGPNIFTGARDWQVFVWRWDSGVLHAVDQFQGHQLPVRCLAYENRYLYSGGDEGVIRCIDMTSCREVITCGQVVPGFPITCNKGGVKSLCATADYLFSGDEESIVVWSARTGEHIKLLLRSEGAILTLLKDETGGRIWSGGVDGVIRLWEAAGDFALICSLNDHNGSFVRGLVPLSRVSATKAWTISKTGVLQLWYTESDCSEFDNQTSQEELRLISVIDSLRDTIVTNYSRLEDHKIELRRIELLEAGRKQQLVEAFEKASNIGTKRKYYGKLFSYLSKVKRDQKAMLLCHSLAATSISGLRVAYYGKLRRYGAEVRENRNKIRYAASILGCTERSLQMVYFRKLRDYANRWAMKKKKSEVAHSFERHVTGGLQRATLFKWQRWTFKRRQAKKRRTVSHALFRHTKNGLLYIYYAKLVAYHSRERETAKTGTLTDALITTMWRSMRHVYFVKWLRWYRRKSDAGRKRRFCQVLMRGTTNGVIRMYYMKWMDWMMNGMYKALENKYNEIQDNIKKLEIKIKAQKFVTEEELEKKLKSLEQEIEEAATETSTLENEASKLSTACTELEMEVNGYLHLDPNKAVSEQVVAVCAYLKARGVSCRYDIKSISHADGRNGRGVDTFSKGIDITKRTLQQSGYVGNEHWGCSSERIKELEPKYLREAHRGIKEIILGVDQMKYYNERFPPHLCQELLSNIHVLYEVVTRVHGERLAGEAVKLREDKRARELDPYATTRGKLINETQHSLTKSSATMAKTNSGLAKSSSGLAKKPPKRAVSSEREHSSERPPREPRSPVTPTTPLKTSPRARSVPPEGDAPQKKANPGFRITEDMTVLCVTSKSARNAGLRIGDLLTHVGTKSIKAKTNYIHSIKQKHPGDFVDFRIVRGSTEKSIRIQMGEM
eukprot:TRINITY_DN2594_c3_g1_i2.p1 TRINITY_DN2594_c3_g1~~TRINITY_DN2594_c3_g1_i2.p1  ORF type:complete len:1051 (+),score=174.54 TRINITY_DN2594_c3_g1_i2:364-3516(+)